MNPLILGIAIIVLFLFVLVGFFVKGAKLGFFKATIDTVVSAGALCGAVFLAKPIILLIDKMANFSMLFFDRFMQMFSKIPLMNELVDRASYTLQVQKFAEADIAMDGWLKKFLSLVFSKIEIAVGETTTLGTIASNVFSYIFVSLIVSVVTFLLLRLIANAVLRLIFKKRALEHSGISKFFGGVLAVVTGAIYCAYVFVLLTVVPLFGISGETMSTAIEKTIVLQTPYQFVQAKAEDVFCQNFDWSQIVKGKTVVKDDLITTYGAQSQDERYTVKITLIDGNHLSETVIDSKSGTTQTRLFTFVLANGRMYEYSLDSELNRVLYATRHLSAGKKTIDYAEELHDEDDNVTKLSLVLSAIAE